METTTIALRVKKKPRPNRNRRDFLTRLGERDHHPKRQYNIAGPFRERLFRVFLSISPSRKVKVLLLVHPPDFDAFRALSIPDVLKRSRY
ncbi:hypothetical protein GWI33_009141 [Rhynchophorus ferrugineus]|uniref:Uncharacterized protein n=1 Tax=Rhynchophorus ferrugineus TaxID=354439 RepID=A0A834IPX9_RHYFE|nr:hypothetical protein GWI33_009141 [Rhynchophorus ferrugineus]